MKGLSRQLLILLFSILIFTTVSEARFFDSCSGRWTTRDPLGEGSDTNLYRPMGNNPVNNVDPLGLETYRCTKPLHALTDAYGASTAEWAYNNVPYAYHQYSCVVLSDGSYQCQGQDREGSWWRSPGKPSIDDFDPKYCKQSQPDNDCFEKCMIEEWGKPRPTYGIPFGKDCQNYDNDINKRCLKECFIKR